MPAHPLAGNPPVTMDCTPSGGYSPTYYQRMSDWHGLTPLRGGAVCPRRIVGGLDK